MRNIFVNLKRFEIPKKMGGICPVDNPLQWIEWVIDECVKSGLGKLEELEITFLLPEALVPVAVLKLSGYPESKRQNMNIGCQGVYREDVTPGGNFGAFTTNRPAAAAKNIGCIWAIIGHSEERKDKLGIIAQYDPATVTEDDKRFRAKKAVDFLINAEAICSLKAGINVLICVGETAEEKGEGSFEEQKPRIETILRSQLEIGLKGIADLLTKREIIIGYEPIWAIGPGKTPPSSEYIGYVSNYIKIAVAEMYGFKPKVVYGGGLKEENAGSISKVNTINGGLVALTRFSGEIGFYPDELRRIIDKYLE